MARRKAYTKLNRLDHVRPSFVEGMGDVAYKGFNCPAMDCRQWIFLASLEVQSNFDFECPSCRRSFHSGDSLSIFRYELWNTESDTSISSGNFELLLDDYLAEAEQYKYCLYCGNLKPLAMFDRHAPRQTGRQGECSLCKRTYNSIKNQTRLTDQHREAAQKRRLYVDLGVTEKVNSAIVKVRFKNSCFNCDRDLSKGGEALDHTLPVYYLWPLTTESATLLCARCNGDKSGDWPSAFYSDQKLRRLASITGISFDLLAGPPQLNPVALQQLQDPVFVDAMIDKYAAYMDEILKLRNRILKLSQVDFFEKATQLSTRWVQAADNLL